MASSTILYPIVSLVESAFIRQGYPAFQVGSAWKCNSCFESTAPLCPICRTAYVHAVGHLNYSDFFEKRLNQTMGTAGVLLGPSALLLNASRGLWTPGPVALKITASLASYIPYAMRGSEFLGLLWNVLLVALVALAVLVLTAGFGVVGFLMCVNPGSPRHWRHFTPRAAALSFLMGGYWLFLAFNGVGPAEFGLVYGPSSFGVICFLLVGCMRETERGVELEDGLNKMDGDEEKIWI